MESADNPRLRCLPKRRSPCYFKSSLLSPNIRLAFVFVTLLYLIGITRVECCEIERCSREFESVLMTGRQNGQNNLNTPAPLTKAEHCRPLKGYNQCLEAIAKMCRGNLNFHTVKTLVRQWIIQNNCTATGIQKMRHAIKSAEPNPEDELARHQMMERRRNQRAQEQFDKLKDELLERKRQEELEDAAEDAKSPVRVDRQTASSSKSTFILCKANLVAIFIIVLSAKLILSTELTES